MAHDNWELSYAGVELPPPDSGGMALELQPVDSAERNANGDLIIEAVTLKRKLNYTRSMVDGKQAHSFFSTLENNRTGALKYFDIAKNSMNEIQAYYGAGVKISYLRYDDELNKSMYSAISANFIEA